MGNPGGLPDLVGAGYDASDNVSAKYAGGDGRLVRPPLQSEADIAEHEADTEPADGDECIADDHYTGREVSNGTDNGTHLERGWAQKILRQAHKI